MEIVLAPKSALGTTGAVTPNTSERTRATHGWLAALAALLGTAACVWLATRVGLQALSSGLWVLLPWLPLLLLLELGRPLMEWVATGYVLDAYGSKVPIRTRLRAQLLAHALDIVMPAGRTVGEAGKSAVLTPTLGVDRAFAVGAAGQALTLLSSALWALLGLALSSMLGASAGVVGATLVYTVATVSLVGLIVIAARLARPSPWIARLPHVQGCARELDTLVRSHPRQLLLSIVALLGARVLQAGQIAILLGVLGATVSLSRVALASNVYVVSAAAGELVPAQLGVTDGAFALSATDLTLLPHAVLAFSLGLHAIQLCGAACAALAFALSGGVGGTRSAFDRSNV